MWENFCGIKNCGKYKKKLFIFILGVGKRYSGNPPPHHPSLIFVFIRLQCKELNEITKEMSFKFLKNYDKISHFLW